MNAQQPHTSRIVSSRARHLRGFMLFVFALALVPTLGIGAGGDGHGASAATTFLFVAVLLLFARFAGVVERFGFPAVLGELLAGVILGNLFLFGIGWFEGVTGDTTLGFLAELGVVILLFQIGLESNLGEMKKVGGPAVLVALIGVVAPFVLGAYIVGPWLLPGLSLTAYLFLGAALTATSVGVTARVFKDLDHLRAPEAQTVLGAAVIDDVLGLIILAVVTGMATAGMVSAGIIGWITAKAILFLVGAIVIGRLVAPSLGRLFSGVNSGVGMKLTLAVCFCLLTAAFAQFIGLAPIVGAFAAGLVLDPVHFRNFKDPKVVNDVRAALASEPEEVRERVLGTIEPHARRHVEDLIEPLGQFLVPLFFVFTGMKVRLDALFRLDVILLAIGITLVAIAGKAVAGLAAPRGTRLLVGVGMIPRGEVGLIFAAIGSGLGVIDARLYAIIVLMVILTTIIPPPILSLLIRRSAAASAAAAVAPAGAEARAA
jgi:Kef-type K+ transport system membrane component KefB